MDSRSGEANLGLTWGQLACHLAPIAGCSDVATFGDLCPRSSTFFTYHPLWPSAFLVLPLCIDTKSSFFFSTFFSNVCSLWSLSIRGSLFLPRGHDSAVSYSNSELNYLLASRDRWLGKGLSVWAGFIAVLISFVSPAWETSNQHRATTKKGDKSHIRCDLPVLKRGNTKPRTQASLRVIQIGIQKPASLLIA